MRLLIITQKVDLNDSVLGFFHRWIVELSKKYESIVVICLYKGKNNLPSNVKLLSLGKEDGQSKLKYIFNFYKYIWSEKNNYDSIFVHMNQEYILLAGIIWKVLKKNVYMWRNHHSGSLLTDIAAKFCTKVFCTSKFSYTAKYRNTEIMPVGVDLENFKPVESIKRVDQSVLFLGRISPVKKPNLLIKIIPEIKKEFPNLECIICGDPLPKDQKYIDQLVDMVKVADAQSYISFNKGVRNTETVDIYSKNNIFINLSSSGMYDKTIFEAIACGCLIVASNDNLIGQIDNDFIFKQDDTVELSIKIKSLLKYTPDQRVAAVKRLQDFAKKHSLSELGNRLLVSIK